MPKIHFTEFIAAPASRVYDVARNFSILKSSFDKEQVSTTASSNTLKDGDTITIQARHLSKTRSLVLKLYEKKQENMFREVMHQGSIPAYCHEHYFKQIDNGTIMIDILEFELPSDFIGKIFGKYFMEKYLQVILQKRVAGIKQHFETNQ